MEDSSFTLTRVKQEQTSIGFEFVAVKEGIKEEREETDYSLASTYITRTPSAHHNIFNRDCFVRTEIQEIPRVISNCSLGSELEKDICDVKEKSTYKCSRCDLSFITNDLLNSHVTKSHNIEYKCLDCVQNFTDVIELQRHVQLHHIEKTDEKRHILKEGSSKELCQSPILRFSCTSVGCSDTFDSQDRLYEHMSSAHRMISYYKCDECNRQFYTKRLLNSHKHHHIYQKRKVKCIYCNKFYDSQKVEGHINLSHKRFKCSICQMGFTVVEELQSHATEIHPNFVQKRVPKRRSKYKYRCPGCKAAFESQMQFVTHKCGPIPDPCEFCGVTCESFDAMGQHKATHQKLSYSCFYCSRKFFTKFHAAKCERIHMRAEVARRVKTICEKKDVKDNRPKGQSFKYYCDNCKMGFNLKSNLREHYVLSKDFPCSGQR